MNEKVYEVVKKVGKRVLKKKANVVFFVKDKHHLLKNGEFNLTLKRMCSIMKIKVPDEYKSKEKEKISAVALNCNDAIKDSIYIYMDDDEETCSVRLNKAYEQGVKFILMDSEFYKSLDKRSFKKMPIITYDNLYAHVGKFFAYIRNLTKSKVVTITGTVGKTTTTRLVECVCKDNFKAFCSPGNTNSFRAAAKHILNYMIYNYEVYIQECGAGSLGSIRKAACMLEPNYFILLNVTNHHMNKYKTYENLFEDKSSFQDYIKPNGCGVVNYDDEGIANTKFKCPIKTFGIETKRDVDYRAINIKQNNEYLEFDVKHNNKKTHVKINIMGEHNVYDALGAYVVAKELGVSDEKIAASMLKFRPEGIRQNIRNVGGINLYVDCYNVCNSAILADLKAMEHYKLPKGGRKIAVLGGENKLGSEAYDVTYKFARSLKNIEVDEFICYGPRNETEYNLNRYGHGRALYEGLLKAGHKNVTYVTSRNELVKILKERVKAGDLVLFKSIYLLHFAPTIDRAFNTSYAINNEYYKTRTTIVENSTYVGELVKTMTKVSITKVKKKTLTKVVIPKRVDTKIVYRLNNKLYYRNRNVKTVDFGPSVKNIGVLCFGGCKNITSLTLPSNVEVIEAKAFKNCTSLKEVKIEDGLKHIDSCVFEGCTSLKTISIPNSVLHIEDNAFEGCKDLVIECNKNSYASKFAKKNNIKTRTLK